jgi:hypothetical protein
LVLAAAQTPAAQIAFSVGLEYLLPRLAVVAGVAPAQQAVPAAVAVHLGLVMAAGQERLAKVMRVELT